MTTHTAAPLRLRAINPLPEDCSLEEFTHKLTLLGFNVQIMTWPNDGRRGAQFSIRVESYSTRQHFGGGTYLDPCRPDEWTQYAGAPDTLHGCVVSVVRQFNEWIQAAEKKAEFRLEAEAPAKRKRRARAGAR